MSGTGIFNRSMAASLNMSGTDFNGHVLIKIPKFNRHVPIKILKFERHVPIEILFITKHLPIKAMRRQSSKFTKDHTTQHNTYDEGCDLLEAGLQGRGPKIVLLAPEVGHRLVIVNLAHQIKGLLKIPCLIDICMYPPESSIFA